MNTLNFLYFTWDQSAHTWKSDHYFKMEFKRLPDVRVRFITDGGHVPELLKRLDFEPDFIYMDDYEALYERNTLPTGLDQVNIPKGVLHHDLHKSQSRFRSFVHDNRIDLLFAHYRDAFLRFYPDFKDRFRWLPLHVYEPVIKRYKFARTIDFLMMGRSDEKTYPLRAQMIRTMTGMPGFVSHGHPGYRSVPKEQEKEKFLNEYFAMELSRAKMFLTCGSVFNYPLGKYFEAAACKTLLLAAGFPELKDLGFIDKETYVKINKHNFLDKAHYYLRHEEERNAIRAKGFYMVLTLHTTDIRARQFVDEIWKFTGKTR